eukprot:s702_g36.t1
MAALTDSKAHFTARATEYGVPEGLIDSLRLAGVTTFAHLAFAICRPGQDLDEAKFDAWVTQVNGGVAPTVGALSALRRLHFEAEIVVTSSLKAAVEQPQETTTPRPLPQAERTARMNQMRQQFNGLNLEGINEPSQALVDECCHQNDTKVLRYIEPAKCNSRESEVAIGRTDRKLRIESNTLSVKEAKTTPDEDVSTSYKLQLCMRRRAVAYEFASLISFRTHEKYIDKLFRRLNTEPPPNYQATSLSQILRADREVWVHMSQNIDDIKQRPDGTRPLDAALMEALSDYNVTFHLLPLPLPSSSSYAPVRNRDTQPAEYGYKGKSSGKKGKGKGKNQQQGSSFAPRGIKGAVGRDAKGRAICFNYNLGECTDAPVGTAGVTAAFKRLGFENSVAVDKTRSRGALASIIQLDLTKPEDQLAVLSWVKHPAIKGVFLAPPCGTASTARQIELPGESAPKPLRTLDEPNGLSNLSGLDQQRVSAANILYEFTAEVMDLCTQLDKPCMVENPRNSLFWMTTYWAECESGDQHYIQDHQACAYGAQRAKWTRLVANFEHVHTVCLVCPGDHTHLPWGVIQTGNKKVFATSLEVHYPKKLCDAIAHAFHLRLLEQGLQGQQQPSLQHLAKAATFCQTPSLKLPPLVSPYKSRFVVFFAGADVVWPVGDLPLKASKMLHEVKFGELVSVKHFSPHTTTCSIVQKCLDEELTAWHVDFALREFSDLEITFDKMTIFGLQWDPVEFLEKSLQVNHPVGVEASLPKELMQTVEEVFRLGPLGTSKRRLQFFKQWNLRARELENDERKLRSEMDPVVEKAVSGKRILLFEEMLKHYGYPDLGVVDELKFGSSLIGDVPETFMLPAKFTPAVVTPESLKLQSRMRRPMFDFESGSSGDKDVDMEVWRQTLEERDRGWISGPIPLCEIDEGAPISRRFGLKQKHKVRLIDDFTESSVNQAVTVFESPVLHTVDIACSLISFVFTTAKQMNMSSEMFVRTFDLSSAYRQIALSEDGRQVAFIRVFDPHSEKLVYFQVQVLPFGAVRSVHSFLRVARAIWWLGVVGCLLQWSSFFDDFIVFSSVELSRSTELTVSALFKLLGWLFAQEGRKCVPFGETCEALGVVFDLSQSKLGVCKITNTAARVEELQGEIQRILEKGWISQIEAQKLRGRMQFADSQIYGRTGRRCTKTLRDFAGRRRSKISERDEMFLKLFVRLLQSEEPRRVLADSCSHVVIFTDACYERDSRDLPCGLGGAFVDPSSGRKFFFSCPLDSDKHTILGEQSKKQIIFEAETLCAVLAHMLWAPELEDSKSFLYVDNEGTKFCLIRGSSENDFVDMLAQIFAENEISVKTLWINKDAHWHVLCDEIGDDKLFCMSQMVLLWMNDDCQMVLPCTMMPWFGQGDGKLVECDMELCPGAVIRSMPPCQDVDIFGRLELAEDLISLVEKLRPASLLHFAAAGDWPACLLLIPCGLSLEKDGDGRTPSEIAHREGHLDLAFTPKAYSDVIRHVVITGSTAGEWSFDGKTQPYLHAVDKESEQYEKVQDFVMKFGGSKIPGHYFALDFRLADFFADEKGHHEPHETRRVLLCRLAAGKPFDAERLFPYVPCDPKSGRSEAEWTKKMEEFNRSKPEGHDNSWIGDDRALIVGKGEMVYVDYVVEYTSAREPICGSSYVKDQEDTSPHFLVSRWCHGGVAASCDK